MINVYEFEHQGTSPVDEEDVLTAVAAYFDAAYDNIDSYVSNYVGPVDIKVDVVDVISGVKKVISNVGTILWGSDYAPSGAGERIANGLAALVKLFTLSGKTFGKKFIGVFTETDANGNAMGGALQAALASMITDLLVDLVVDVTEDFAPGVLSVSQDAPGIFFSFVEGAIEAGWAYQRRRKPGVGS